MGSLTRYRYGSAVVTLKNIGTYVIGGGNTGSSKTTDFLASGSQQWVAGPDIPVDIVYGCSVVIGQQSFLAIDSWSGNRYIREYQVDLSNPTSTAGWQDASKWPQLQANQGNGIGCSKVSQRVVVAGYSGKTEILDLAKRTIEYAGDLNTRRVSFHIISTTTGGVQKTFALGGYYGGYLDSVEEFDPDTLTWNTLLEKLSVKRHRFGAIALPRSTLLGTEPITWKIMMVL